MEQPFPPSMYCAGSKEASKEGRDCGRDSDSDSDTTTITIIIKAASRVSEGPSESTRFVPFEVHRTCPPCDLYEQTGLHTSFIRSRKGSDASIAAAASNKLLYCRTAAAAVPHARITCFFHFAILDLGTTHAPITCNDQLYLRASVHAPLSFRSTATDDDAHGQCPLPNAFRLVFCPRGGRECCTDSCPNLVELDGPFSCARPSTLSPSPELTVLPLTMLGSSSMPTTSCTPRGQSSFADRF